MVHCETYLAYKTILVSIIRLTILETFNNARRHHEIYERNFYSGYEGKKYYLCWLLKTYTFQL